MEWFREYCMSLPGATEQIQWVDDLVFKVGGKMFAISVLLATHPIRCSFKCTPEDFAELTERPGIIPAPYLARSSWIAMESWDALPRAQVCTLLRQSYDLVVAGLPKKLQPGPATPAASEKPVGAKKAAVKKTAAKKAKNAAKRATSPRVRSSSK